MSLSALIVLATVAFCSDSNANVNNVFSDGMILQCNAESGYNPFIYGYDATPQEKITLNGNIQGAPYTIYANSNGTWNVEIIGSKNFGANFTINIASKSNTININNIKMGDVFLCIGDENMLYPMSDIINGSNEIKNSINYPSIRIITIPPINSNKASNNYPSNVNIKWQQANPSTLPSFSAMCYLSAQKLLKMYGDHRPMGLIQVAVSKSTLNCWMSSDAITKASMECGDYKNKNENINVICNDSSLYNGMIAPIIKLVYRSGIYYGDSGNISSYVSNYGCKFAVMINDYRDKFGSGDYPFAFIQASSTLVASNNHISELRKQQTMDKPHINGSLDTTAMIVSYDLGNKSSNTPSNKLQIAERVGLKLARIAPVILYDHNSSLYDGPIVISAVYNYNDINQSIILTFTNLGVHNNESLILIPTTDCVECCNAENVFQVSNDNKNWMNITSFHIEDNVNNVLIVETTETNINYIQYALTNFVECAVMRNGLNIPAEPFNISVINASESKTIGTQGTVTKYDGTRVGARQRSDDYLDKLLDI